MSLRALASRLFLVLLGVLAVAGAGEFVLRASTALGLDAPLGDEHNPRFVLSSNRRLLVEMDPNDPHLNADGLRDREYAVAKPPDTVRIAALGDSVTYGHSVELDQAYTKQLEVLLNADADVRFEVINFGVGGYNTRQELEHFKVKARRYSPDLLLIGYTMNDVLDTETFLQVMGGQPAAEEWSFRDFLRRSRFAAWVMDRSARVDLAENPRAYFVHLYPRAKNWRIVTDSFAEFAALAEEDGFDVLLVIFPYLDALEPYRYAGVHRAVEREAHRNGFEVLDLLKAFQARELDDVRLSPSDPVHPSPEGHAVAARAIQAYLGATRTKVGGSWKPKPDLP